jgi:hypothetical protein
VSGGVSNGSVTRSCGAIDRRMLARWWCFLFSGGGSLAGNVVSKQAQRRRGFSMVLLVSETIVINDGWWGLADWARARACRGAANAGRGGVSDSGRHHSVRASFDWSYQLLEARERELLRRLSVFVGGCTVVSAHAVAGPLLDEGEVRRLLVSLEAKGLIVAVTARAEKRWAFLESRRRTAKDWPGGRGFGQPRRG